MSVCFSCFYKISHLALCYHSAYNEKPGRARIAFPETNSVTGKTMKQIKTIILEDEKEQQDQTMEFLRRFSDETGSCQFQVRCFSSGLEFLEKYHNDADLIFLDIRMPGMTGMEVAKEIRKTDTKSTIIFITSLSQYAIEGYSVNAVDYILKPISYPEFKLKMSRIVSNITLKDSQSMTIANEDGLVRLLVSSIMYVETNLHNVIIYDNEGKKYKKHASMHDIEDTIHSENFLRINSSYLVNLDYVDSLKKGFVILRNGTELKISRPRLKEVQEAFMKYQGK